ncbi:transcription factor [Klebsormidium nitens]|uniref:Transcription factor n=1 Tax=Klebsormidium nitens TaxID=105231 RepID=A0A1Y1I801_KLENI|nr:transcription factor [Klebsormidium nitens]|eukprot:GAQ85559.1 transcription factor [Klebsormidium nitens]
MGGVGTNTGPPSHPWCNWAANNGSNPNMANAYQSAYQLSAGRWTANKNTLTWQGGSSVGNTCATDYLNSVLLDGTDDFGGWKREADTNPLEERAPDPLRKGAWTDEEDQILREHVTTTGEKDWNRVKMVYGLQRSGKSCRLRYMNHLRPHLKKERFTGAELRLVMQLQGRYGNKWALIANHFKGRTDNEVKNAWHTRRRQMERERRKALKWQAAEQSGACTASCGSDVIDGRGCAASSLCGMGAVHSHGSQELFCSEQLPGRPFDPPAAAYGAHLGMDVPVTHPSLVLPDESYPGPWNQPLSQWPDYPASESCSPQAYPPVTFTGPLQLAPIPKTQSSGSLSTVHSCTPVLYGCHVATLERAASTVTDASVGLVIEGPSVSSLAARSFVGDGGENGARPAESVCSAAAKEDTWPFEAARLATPFLAEPATGASSPGTKLRIPAPPRLVIPDAEPDRYDASWADNIYLSPIGPFPNLSPVLPLQSRSPFDFGPPNGSVGSYRSRSPFDLAPPIASVGPYRSRSPFDVGPHSAPVGQYRPHPQARGQLPGGSAPWTSAQFSSCETGWRATWGEELDALLTSRHAELALEELGLLKGTLAGYSEWPAIAPTGSSSDWTVGVRVGGERPFGDDVFSRARASESSAACGVRQNSVWRPWGAVEGTGGARSSSLDEGSLRTEAQGLWKRARGVEGVVKEPVNRWGDDEIRRFYAESLQTAAGIANRGVSEGFEDGRKRTWSEFREFCEHVGIAADQAADVDVLAFVQGFWLPRHLGACRTFGSEGEKVASASAIKAVLSHLGKSFSMLGRSAGENPVHSESVRSYREGYRNWLHDLGVREKRAKVFAESKVNDLLRWLQDEVEKKSGLGKCCALTDLAIVNYLWESWSRGRECGELEARQVGFKTEIVVPGWSKTVRTEPSAEIPVSGGFLEAAARLISACENEGQAVGSGFLFRPLNARKNGFKNEAMKNGTMRRRVQQRLKEAGLFEGETLHSFRRSAVQHAAEIEGYDVPRLMARGRWSSYAAFRIYVEEIASRFPRRLLR